MSNSNLKRLGREHHTLLGPCVRVSMHSWDGGTEPGATGRDVWTEYLIPRTQWCIMTHPRHITAYDPTGTRRSGSIPPAHPNYVELCKYGSLRFSHPEDADYDELERIVREGASDCLAAIAASASRRR